MKNNLLLLFVCLVLASDISFAKNDSGVIDYFQSLKTFKASFLQYNNDGSVSAGVLYVNKPRYLRLEYNYPDQIIINVNGPFVTYYDKDLDQAMNIPATHSLIKVFRNNHRDFGSDLYYKSGKAYISINTDDNSVVIMKFGLEPIQIEGLNILQDGYNVRVVFSNVGYNIPINNGIFSDFE